LGEGLNLKKINSKKTRLWLRSRFETKPNQVSSVRRKFSDFACKNLILVREGFRNSISLSSSSENIKLKFFYKLRCWYDMILNQKPFLNLFLEEGWRNGTQ
jgi:hypothetical protein